MAKTTKTPTVKSYIKAQEDESFKPFVIELVEGERIEIPSLNNQSNDFKTTFARLNFKMEEIGKIKNPKTKAATRDKQLNVTEDIYHLINETFETFRLIDNKFGSTLWWMVFKDFAQFCSEQLKVSDQGK